MCGMNVIITLTKAAFLFPRSMPILLYIIQYPKVCMKFIQYLVQQTAQSIMENHLSLLSLLHVLNSIWSTSQRYIQRHRNTVILSKMCEYSFFGQ